MDKQKIRANVLLDGEIRKKEEEGGRGDFQVLGGTSLSRSRIRLCLVSRTYCV